MLEQNYRNQHEADTLIKKNNKEAYMLYRNFYKKKKNTQLFRVLDQN